MWVERHGLWIVRPDGTGLRQIVDGLAGGDASWAPDGRSIAFSQPSHDGNGYDIYSADVASGNVTRLVTGKATDLWPVWWHPQD